MYIAMWWILCPGGLRKEPMVAYWREIACHWQNIRISPSHLLIQQTTTKISRDYLDGKSTNLQREDWSTKAFVYTNTIRLWNRRKHPGISGCHLLIQHTRVTEYNIVIQSSIIYYRKNLKCDISGCNQLKQQ